MTTLTLAVPLSDQEKAKICSVMELARQGFNHLACLDLKAREKDRDLINLLMEFYNDGPNSPARKMAAHLALSIRHRDSRILGPRFKQLGRSMGCVFLTHAHAKMAGNQITVMNTVHLVAPEGTFEHYELDKLSFEVDEDAVHVSLLLKDRVDKKGSLRLESNKIPKTLGGLRRQRGLKK